VANLSRSDTLRLVLYLLTGHNIARLVGYANGKWLREGSDLVRHCSAVGQENQTWEI
jgi:hypothetical protein